MADQSTRRRFLTATGALGAAALAGCSALGGGGDGASTETEMDDMDDSMTETTEGSMDDSMTETMTEDGMMGPMDPAEAPRASIDRFSEAAGTLMVRTEENGLPGPDEPIDYDQSPFLTLGLGPAGEPVSYYNFDVQPTQPAPIYAFFREGEETPVDGQLNVVGTIPGDQGYNDFWHVHKVTVPSGYEANTVTSEQQLMAGDFAVESTSTIKNCPIVPEGSTASMRYGDGDTGLVDGWYDGQVVSYFLFEEAPIMARDGGVPVSPIYVSFNKNPDEDGGGPPSGFKTEEGSDRTHNVLATLPGDDGYSPLWLVNIYDNAEFDEVTDLDSATNAEILAAGAATVNCPVVAGGMDA
ncbi:MAG: hypothetical protein U5J98_09175 [Halobacteriales archaeon]|nr:hypothetical protein [Halobacteriales archaeon]